MKKITLLAVMALVCMSVSLSTSAQNADTLYFYKGGQIVIKIPVAEIDSFTFTPQAPVFEGYGIDLAMTAQYGGMFLDNSYNKNKYAVFFYEQGIKIYLFAGKQWLNFPWSQISKDWKDLAGTANFKVGYDIGYNPFGPCVILFDSHYDCWSIIPIFATGNGYLVEPSIWEVNGGTPFVNFKITMELDKSVTLDDGKDKITAKEW